MPPTPLTVPPAAVTLDSLSGQRIACSSLLRMPQPVVPGLPEPSLSTAAKSSPTLSAAESDTTVLKEQLTSPSEPATPAHPPSTSPMVSPKSTSVSTLNLPATATTHNHAPRGAKLECGTAVPTLNVSDLRVAMSPADGKLCAINKPSSNGLSAWTKARSSTVLKDNKRSVGNKENVSISSKDSRKNKRALF
jgi:hypothetical protein